MAVLKYRPLRRVKVAVLLQTNSFAVPGRQVFGIADMQRQAEWLMSHLRQDWGAEIWCNVELEIEAAGEARP